MENKYMDLYNTSYHKILKEVEIKYRERILEYKILGYNAEHVIELFCSQKPSELENNLFNNIELKNLIDQFNNRNKIYDAEHLHKAFDEFIIPEYERLKNNPFKNFTDFICQYANFKAWKEVDYRFSLNVSTYKLMYKHNLLKNFKIIGYNGGDHSSEFFKYLQIENPSRIDPFEHLEKLRKRGIFNFSQKDESIYNLIFSSKSCYDYLILKDYLHISSSFEDYKNVFLKNFTENTSIIKFYCTTIKASVFLRSLENINEKMDLEKIGITRKFKSKRDHFLKGSTLRQQKSRASDDLIREVNYDLEKLKELVIKKAYK